MQYYKEYEKIPPKKVGELWALLEDLLSPLQKRGYDPVALISTSEFLRGGFKGSKEQSVPFIDTIGVDSQCHQGVVFTIVEENKRIEEATNDLSESSMSKAVSRLMKRVNSKPEKIETTNPLQLYFEYGGEKKELTSALELANKNRELIFSRDNIAFCSSTYSHIVEEKIVVRKGVKLAQRLQFPHGMCYAITKNHYEYIQTWLGKETFNNQKMSEAIEWCTQIAPTGSFPSGKYPVVCSGDVAGVIGHETFGHGDELDTIIAGRAKAIHFFQKRVGSHHVTLIDTPSPNSFGFYAFDDDGTLVDPKNPTTLMKNGILTNAMSDRVSLKHAKTMGLPLVAVTPNARRESPLHRLSVRMSNTYFEPSTTPLDEMISMVDDGFYLPLEGNGMENPKEWTLQIKIPLAIRIRKGRLTNEVYGNVLMTGDVIDILHDIRAVGDSISGEGMGYCGKERQDYVRVANKSAPFLTQVNLSCP